MVEDEIEKADISLLYAFIEREARDYTPNKDMRWANECIQRILKLRGSKTERLTVSSYTNMGLLSRQIVITYDNPTSVNLELILCTCGDPAHIRNKNKRIDGEFNPL